MRTPHRCCRRGKRVLVILRDGTRIEDVFEEKVGNAILLRKRGRVPDGEIRSFRLLRGGG